MNLNTSVILRCLSSIRVSTRDIRVERDREHDVDADQDQYLEVVRVRDPRQQHVEAHEEQDRRERGDQALHVRPSPRRPCQRCRPGARAG